jgi:hypothetical protein
MCPPGALELFRLRGKSLELRGLAIETSFGYGFGLELDSELILMHLQRTVESLVDYALRMESALIAQGWHVIAIEPGTRSRASGWRFGPPAPQPDAPAASCTTSAGPLCAISSAPASRSASQCR